MQYFIWINDAELRTNALHSEPVKFKDHKFWYENHFANDNCVMLIFFLQDKPLGQVRFDQKEKNNWLLTFQ